MENKRIVQHIREDLQKHWDPKTKESTKRFFKETVLSYGVKTSLVKDIAKRHFKDIQSKPKAEVFSACSSLWASGYLEETFIACDWSHRLHRQYKPTDFQQFQEWVFHYISNWASCDTFCNHTLGTFLEMYPDHIKELYKWAESNNRWVRRASAVSLIVPVRRGMFLAEVFHIAGILLLDTDDMVQKGYGWLLKVASQTHETEVFDYVMKYKSSMPRTSLRYAIEKMPIKRKQVAMRK
jgi:3-methyladenine DNA glycosylase AlkD